MNQTVKVTLLESVPISRLLFNLLFYILPATVVLSSSPSHISLTFGHLLSNPPDPSVIVTRKPRRILPHPGSAWVSPRGSEFLPALDFALIELDEPVLLRENILPACLPDPGDVFPPTSICYATGFGRNDTSSYHLVRKLV